MAIVVPVGDTHRVYTINLVDGLSVAETLVGATAVQCQVRAVTALYTGVYATIAGTCTIVTTTPAVLAVQFATADVVAPGTYTIRFQATFSSGIQTYFETDFVVQW